MRLLRVSLKWIWILTGNSPQPRRVKWKGGSLRTNTFKKLHVKSSNLEGKRRINHFVKEYIKKYNKLQTKLMDPFVPTTSRLLARGMNNASHFGQGIVALYFWRGPLTAHFKICELKRDLWAPTSLPSTQMPTMLISWSFVKTPWSPSTVLKQYKLGMTESSELNCM